jgi:hypothetical protein
METSKFKKLYLLFNIPLISLFFVLLFSPFFIADKWVVYYIGIIDRVTLGIWCIFNGIWNSSTDYYSLLKNNRFQKNRRTPKWAWWLLLIVGVLCLITAYCGYGFNNIKKPM